MNKEIFELLKKSDFHFGDKIFLLHAASEHVNKSAKAQEIDSVDIARGYDILEAIENHYRKINPDDCKRFNDPELNKIGETMEQIKNGFPT